MNNFNGFPATYQPQMYQQQDGFQNPMQTPAYWQRQLQQMYQGQQQPSANYQVEPSNQQTMNNYMIWVQGEAGAKAFNLPRNTTLPLWDSEANVIYIKSVDINGKPSMTTIHYNEDVPSSENEKQAPIESVDTVAYATKEQFDSVIEQLKNLTEQVNSMESKLMNLQNKPQQQNNNRRGNK